MTKINRKEYLNSIKPGQIHWVNIAWDNELKIMPLDYDKVNSKIHKNKTQLKIGHYIVESRPVLTIVKFANKWKVKPIFTLNKNLTKYDLEIALNSKKQTRNYLKLNKSLDSINESNFIKCEPNIFISIQMLKKIVQKQLEFDKSIYLNAIKQIDKKIEKKDKTKQKISNKKRTI